MKIVTIPLLLLLFSIALFSYKADNLALEFKGDENFYFQSSREMLENGDFITPRYLGKERFQKPILFYWLIMGFFKIGGINWFSARLPSMLFGALAVVLIYHISNLLFDNNRIGICAALFTATAPLWYRYARLAVPDMTLAFFIAFALFCYLRRYYKSDDRVSMFMFFAAMAIAFLIKGLVGIALPLLVVAVYHLAAREKFCFSFSELCTGLGLFLLIAVPWFYLMYRQHGDAYVHHLWSREVLQRLGHGQATHFIIRYGKSLGFYASSLIMRFPPYSFFIPFAFVRSIGILLNRPVVFVEKVRRIHLFLVVWVAVVFFFFTFVAERHEHYLLALVPAAFIMVGEFFVSAFSDKRFFFAMRFHAPYVVSVTALILFTFLFVASGTVFAREIELSQWWLLLVPIALFFGYRYKESIFMPLSFVLSVAVLHAALAASPPFGGLSTNKMEYAAEVITTSFSDGDRIGVGSHGIIPEELQVYFEEVSVEVVKVRYNADATPNYETAQRLLRFFSSGERVFCVIKRRDYDTFVPEEVKKKLHILDSYYVWKRRIRWSNEIMDSVRGGRLRDIRETFQNELYIVSNKG